jgi:Mg/Co/Ni transporter MgtE
MNTDTVTVRPEVTLDAVLGYLRRGGRLVPVTDIAWLIAVALTINPVFAALTGALLALVLVKVGIDPALAGGVLLTTVTDIVGFLAFLGLGTLFLL